MSYQVSGPSSADSVLRHQSYPQVEVRAGTNDPGDAEQERDAAAAGVMAGDSRQVARAELVLAADAARPLRAVPLRPDLLQSFAAAVLDAWWASSLIRWCLAHLDGEPVELRCLGFPDQQQRHGSSIAIKCWIPGTWMALSGVALCVLNPATELREHGVFPPGSLEIGTI